MIYRWYSKFTLKYTSALINHLHIHNYWQSYTQLNTQELQCKRHLTYIPLTYFITNDCWVTDESSFTQTKMFLIIYSSVTFLHSQSFSHSSDLIVLQQMYNNKLKAFYFFINNIPTFSDLLSFLRSYCVIVSQQMYNNKLEAFSHYSHLIGCIVVVC